MVFYLEFEYLSFDLEGEFFSFELDGERSLVFLLLSDCISFFLGDNLMTSSSYWSSS